MELTSEKHSCPDCDGDLYAYFDVPRGYVVGKWFVECEDCEFVSAGLTEKELDKRYPEIERAE